MEISFDFITFVHLAAVVLGIVSSVIILFFGFKTHPSYQPLGIGQLSISLAVFVSFSIVSQLIVHLPFMYRLGNLFALIFIPMPFLHVVFYTRGRRWKWFDLLHAIPLLMFVIDMQEILLMPNAQKLMLIKQEINDLNVYGEFRQSKYFGPRFHEQFRTVLFSAYWVAQVGILYKWVKGQTKLTRQNRVWKNWMVLFLCCQFFLWFPFYLSLFGFSMMTTYNIVNSFSVVWIMISSLSLFFFPSLLYGMSMNASADAGKEVKGLKKAQITNGEEKKLEDVLARIEAALDGNRFFLIQGYSISDFSRDTEIPVYQISRTINQYCGVGFVDFINQKRIRYCVAGFENGKWEHFSIEAIATECGFSNRNSFTNAFKKYQGVSPSMYKPGANGNAGEK